MNRTTALILVLAVFILASTTHAKDYLVAPGEAWPYPEGGYEPGDRIFLAPGAHRAPILSGIRGTAESPIMIDSADQTQPAMFIGGEYSLQLQRCDHLDVGMFLFMGSEVGGIRIIGTAEQPSTGIRIHDGYIAKPGRDQATRSGIIAKWVDGLTIESMQIDSWGYSAISIADTRNLHIKTVKMTGSIESRFGIILAENVHDARIEEAIVMYTSESGIQLGTNLRNKDDDTLRWAVSNVTIGGCVLIKCMLPIDVGSVRNLLIDHCTLFQPKSCAVGFRESAAPLKASKDVEFIGNLIAWEVGLLGRFLCTPQNTEDLSIGTNLWWSAEMPEGAKYLGPLPGSADERQVYNVDPNLIERTLLPQAQEAKGFGCTAWKPPNTPTKTTTTDPDTAKSEDNPQGT